MQFHRETAIRLAEIYRRLRSHFGYTHPWWPGSPFQITLTAVLVQQCDWGVAWEAVLRLETAGVKTVIDLADRRPEQIHEAIRSVTFAPTKSKRLVGIADWVRGAGFETFEAFLSTDRDTFTVRGQVLARRGIGPETADCLLGFASEHPVFVVDAYTRRIFERLNIVPNVSSDFWQKGRYADIQEFFETHILGDLTLYDEFDFPPELPRGVAILRDYHALLVELGKHHCLKTGPHCYQTGKPGWQNYAYCLDHCLAELCTTCPLSRLCRFPLT